MSKRIAFVDSEVADLADLVDRLQREQDALAEAGQEDCRWSGCYDCGVCTSLGSETQIGPTGKHLLPITPV